MTKTTLSIDGMMCSMCEAHVRDAIRKAVPGAKRTVSDLISSPPLPVSSIPVPNSHMRYWFPPLSKSNVPRAKSIVTSFAAV